MFGRRRKKTTGPVEPIEDQGPDRGEDTEPEQAAAGQDVAPAEQAAADDGPADPVHDGSTGPFDDDAIDNLDELAADPMTLDLGSVLVPIPEGGQVQVELAPTGAVNNVFIAVAGGRVTVNAFSAPRSPGQWRSVVTELSESLRGEGAEVSVAQGPWGREVHGRAKSGDLRFIGVDGPRWMVRCVAVGPAGAVEEDSPLVAAARETLAGTVVRRGDDPMPVRTPLKVTLPQELADKLAGVQQEAAAKHQQAQQQAAMRQLAERQAAMRQALGGTAPRPSDAERAAAGAEQAEAQAAPEPATETPERPAPTPPAQPGAEQQVPAALRRNPQGSALQQLGNKRDKKN